MCRRASNNRCKIILRSSSSLILSNVRRAGVSWKYICNVFVQYLQKYFTVLSSPRVGHCWCGHRVGAAPVIRSLSTAVRVQSGHSVHLKCRVTGRPKPEISWFKDNDSYTPPSDRRVRINRYLCTVHYGFPIVHWVAGIFDRVIPYLSVDSQAQDWVQLSPAYSKILLHFAVDCVAKLLSSTLLARHYVSLFYSVSQLCLD